jgi:hypothetical protein
MVRHGTAKKRRSGIKVSRKPKNRKLIISNAVSNLIVKEHYDKKKSPDENLKAMGLEVDANRAKKRHMKSTEGAKPNEEYAAFVGFAALPKASKERKMSNTDREYAELCISKYGANYKSMSRDIKINYNQLTELKLQKLCEQYEREKNAK